jgi:superkiller protein 3
MRLTGFVLLAVAILLATAPGSSRAIPYEQNPMRLGQKALEQDSLDVAIRHFRKAVQGSPDSFRPRYWLGEALRLNGNLTEAKKTFEDAIKLDPSASDGYAGLGNTALASGDTVMALQSFQKAIQISKDYWEARYGLGRIALARGDTTGARQHFSYGENKNDEGEILYSTGMGLLKLAEGRTDEAEIFLTKAKAKRPNSPEIRRALADLYVAKNVPGLAIAEYEKSIELQPLNAQLHYELGRLYVRTKLYNDGLTQFHRVSELDSTYADAYLQMGRLYNAAKKWTEAAWAYGRYVTYSPTSEGFLLLSQAHREAGSLRASCQAIAEAARLDSAKPEIVRDLARCQYDVRDTAQATASYERLLAESPQVLEGGDYRNLGKTYLERKQNDSARPMFQQAAVMDSTLRDVHFYLGYMDLVAKSFATAVEHFDREVVLNPNSVNSFMYRGMAQLQMKDTDGALASMRQAVVVDSTYFQGWIWLGQTLASAKQFRESEEAYRRAELLKPGNAEALRGIGFVYLSQKRYEDSLVPLRRAVDAEPKNIQGLVWYAQALLLLNRIDEAEPVFKRVLSFDSGNKDAQKGLDFIKAKRERGAAGGE